MSSEIDDKKFPKKIFVDKDFNWDFHHYNYSFVCGYVRGDVVAELEAKVSELEKHAACTHRSLSKGESLYDYDDDGICCCDKCGHIKRIIQ